MLETWWPVSETQKSAHQKGGSLTEGGNGLGFREVNGLVLCSQAVLCLAAECFERTENDPQANEEPC